MMNLPGTPVTAVRDGLWAIWVATRNLPSLWDGSFFYRINALTFTNIKVKLGGTARIEKLVPRDSFSIFIAGSVISNDKNF
jgi:hypothetical protein